MAVARILPFAPSEPTRTLTPEDARRLLNAHAGGEHYTLDEATRLLDAARLIARALLPSPPPRP